MEESGCSSIQWEQLEKKKNHTAGQAIAMREEKNVLVNCEHASVPLAGFWKTREKQDVRTSPGSATAERLISFGFHRVSNEAPLSTHFAEYIYIILPSYSGEMEIQEY